MVKQRSFKSFLIDDTGIAAVEMALILPFMLMLYFGLMDLTGLISFNRKITAVASATADLVGQKRTTILKTDVEDYFKVVKLIMNPTPDSDVKVIVYNYRLDPATDTATLTWKVDNGKGPSCSAAPATSGMKALMTAGNDLVVAQSCMKWTPYVATFLGENLLGRTDFDIEQIVTLRPRATLQLNCQLTASDTAAC
jgi:Flp pilus assembly protein TadG